MARISLKTNYLLIDYENVQPDVIPTLDHEHFRVIVFVGANQTKISLDVAAALQRLGARAEYLKIGGNGTNALDFHIAYTIGKLAATEPDAFFHIISKDTGFDPLIQYLKQANIFAQRSCALHDIPMLRATTAKTTNDRIAVIIAHLKQRKTALPRTIKTLTSSIHALFQKQLSDAIAADLIQQLEQQGIIAMHEKKLVYTLPL
jgi:septum formation topological specificity factor MinE